MGNWRPRDKLDVLNGRTPKVQSARVSMGRIGSGKRSVVDVLGCLRARIHKICISQLVT